MDQLRTFMVNCFHLHDKEQYLHNKHFLSYIIKRFNCSWHKLCIQYDIMAQFYVYILPVEKSPPLHLGPVTTLIFVMNLISLLLPLLIPINLSVYRLVVLSWYKVRLGVKSQHSQWDVHNQNSKKKKNVIHKKKKKKRQIQGGAEGALVLMQFNECQCFLENIYY